MKAFYRSNICIASTHNLLKCMKQSLREVLEKTSPKNYMKFSVKLIFRYPVSVKLNTYISFLGIFA